MGEAWINLAYLLAAVLFIVGLKGLAHPRTAVRGNQLGALGMLIAVVATLAHRQILSFELIIAGIVVGALVGAVLALKVPMTAMPQMVALLNGFGGGASALVAGASLVEANLPEVRASVPMLQLSLASAASGIIGAVTFWGSLVAFAKLQGIVGDNPIPIRSLHYFNGLLLLVAIGLGVMLALEPSQMGYYWALLAVASVVGLLLVFPIGGADMPVVIALLNSYSGLAASATGFVLNNNALIITGSLVGASGIILTTIMCRAMNRSLRNVLFGVWVPAEAGPKAEEVYGGRVKATSPEEVAMLLEGARYVVIVPGYGMAVSQAQHAVRDLMQALEAQGTRVEFAIHPVAGRMPGHMNVLLAEADVPYDKLKEMDEINPRFEQVDVAIVIGANDVVNPLARTDPNSPIAGMPILDVDKAKSVVVIKRSLSPGFAGIPNPLFAMDNTLMLFMDARQGVQEILAALKAK
ncbi:NAD(P) transhydrogenase subunit beta [Armatimonadetes bacterium GBS]|jgi:NAD(P) transhydrogenase subunit beta|nr:NAD(P) transhydrogenase subunit beta [bacterium HR14]GIV12617.1 MAG: NAD(P) transhydrogenase subunit beta [Fimbriimonadales bacterium]CUU11372.1 NAD(P) transhydrogenase subunit beta [Armatimonadetes bacterium GBS]CUU38716.1 NAD(P) transhydrogenase subunit beta [Armatimonadetes bacterium GXS]